MGCNQLGRWGGEGDEEVREFKGEIEEDVKKRKSLWKGRELNKDKC